MTDAALAIKHVDMVDELQAMQVTYELENGRREPKKIGAARNPLVPEISSVRQSVAESWHCEHAFLIRMRI